MTLHECVHKHAHTHTRDYSHDSAVLFKASLPTSSVQLQAQTLM